MPQLRDGTVVSDARLARLQQFDERSRNFAIRDLLTGKDPVTKVWNCKAWLDQGSEGACVGFSMGHELIAQPKVVQNIDDQYAREQIYWEAQKIDPWPGGSYPGASPSYEGTSVLAGIKVLKNLGFIGSYRWSFSISDLVLAVGHEGPAVLGVPWYEGMFEPAPCGYLHPTGEKVGGHAILCRGVNIKRERFLLHNSWGKSWGKDGTAWITWEELDGLLKNGGEAVIPMERVRSPSS
jgi:hypothetical protein